MDRLVNSHWISQELLEEGAIQRQSLQVALSHKELLRDCLGPELAGKMERDGTQTLKDAETHTASLTQRLKVRAS